MLSSELKKKIRRIQIHTKKAVNDVLAGEYGSVFRGRGMEFDEVREYSPGDEIRTIDWNVTARQGHPFVKRYIEERELTVMFMVDLSASGQFGTVHAMKNEVAAEICALLAFSAIQNNDKVGLMIFTDKVELFIPPRKGSRHVLRLIRELLSFKPGRATTDIAKALEFAGRVSKKRGVVFLVSDFLESGFEKPMAVLAKRHDLIAVSVQDPREMHMPDLGLIELEDAETGELILFDSGSARIRGSFERASRERNDELKTTLARAGVDHIEIRTDRDYVRDLVAFFQRREKRRRTA